MATVTSLSAIGSSELATARRWRCIFGIRRVHLSYGETITSVESIFESLRKPLFPVMFSYPELNIEVNLRTVLDYGA